MGIEVVDLNGEKIGEVEDLIFDENEKITGVVVGVGGFLGIGKKEVGLNWDQAELQEEPDTGQKTIMVSLSKADFEAAPDFLTKEEREAKSARKRCSSSSNSSSSNCSSSNRPHLRRGPRRRAAPPRNRRPRLCRVAGGPVGDAC